MKASLLPEENPLEWEKGRNPSARRRGPWCPPASPVRSLQAPLLASSLLSSDTSPSPTRPSLRINSLSLPLSWERAGPEEGSASAQPPWELGVPASLWPCCASSVAGVTWTSSTAAWSSRSSSCAPRSRPSPAASAPTLSSPRGPSSTAPSRRSAPRRARPRQAPRLPLTAHPAPTGHPGRGAVLQARLPEPAQQTPAQVLRVLGEGGGPPGLGSCSVEGWGRHGPGRASWRR